MKKFITLILLAFATTASAQTNSLKIENGVYYNLNGTLFSGRYSQYDGDVRIAELSVENGVLSGASLYFYADGKLREEGGYLAGKRSGNWTQYNELGQISCMASFKADKKHGKWMVRDSKGNLRFEMYYLDGEKVGIWKMWDEEGQLTIKSFTKQ